MFAGPPDQSAAWSRFSGAEGRVPLPAPRLGLGVRSSPRCRRRQRHRRRQRAALDAAPRDAPAAAQVSHDYERLQYNTVVSGAMKMLNAIDGRDLADSRPTRRAARGLSILLRALYPAAPHMHARAVGRLGFAARHGELIDAPWPAVDEAALVQDEIELVLQVNGKLRGAIRVPAAADRAAIEAAALATPSSPASAEGKPARRSSWCRAGWSMSSSEARRAAATLVVAGLLPR
jgi:leucyl-tRNA synthetase